MIRVPEQVPGGGVDDLGAAAGLDLQVVQVGVVMDQDGGDGLGWSLPVLVSLARTVSPALSWLIGTVLPLASRTRVPAVKLFPPGVSVGGTTSRQRR
jgi:hypothetical protein